MAGDGEGEVVEVLALAAGGGAKDTSRTQGRENLLEPSISRL